VWDVQDYVHLVLDVDFTPIIDECKDIALTMAKLDMGAFNMVHPDTTRAVRAFAAQACAITDYWAFDQRPKRQVLELVAGSIFGIMTAAAIEKINNKVDRLDSKLTRGIVVLGHHETRMARIEADLNKTNAKLLWEIVYTDTQMAQLAILQDVALHLQGLSGHTSAISRAWASLNSGKLSWDLLALEQWHQVVNRANAEANRMGGRLPVEAAMDILQFPVSFVMVAQKWRILIHLPVILNEMRLYKHLPRPTTFSTNISDLDKVALLLSTKDHLLISTDDTLHQEITRAELDTACHRIGNRLMCENLGIFHRHLPDTCLGALFSRAAAAALRLCKLQPIQQDWYAMEIPPDRVLLFSKKGRKVDTLCRNGTRFNDRMQGIKEFRLEPGCALSTDTFLSRRSSSVHVEMHFTTTPDWDQMELQEAWEKATNLTRQHRTQAEKDLTQTSLSRDLQEQSRADQDWMQQQLDPNTSHGRTFLLVLVGASVSLAVVLLSVLSYLAYRILRQDPCQLPPAGDRPQGSPEGTHSEEMRSTGRTTADSAEEI
jgi:hypothetical protein